MSPTIPLGHFLSFTHLIFQVVGQANKEFVKLFDDGLFIVVDLNCNWSSCTGDVITEDVIIDKNKVIDLKCICEQVCCLI